MGLKRKSSGALLRHSDGALMSECCCSPPVTDCTVSACLLSANEFPYELLSKIKCDTTTQLGTLRTRSNTEGTLIFTQSGWKTFYDVDSFYYRVVPSVQSAWGDTNYRTEYLGWWWFGSRHLMEPGTYQIEYLGGISNIMDISSATPPSLYSLSFSIAPNDSWAGLSEVKYAIVTMPCLTGEAPTFHDFRGTTNKLDFATALEAESYFKAAQSSGGNVEFTIISPSYIGIVYYIKSVGTHIYAFDKTYRISNFNPTGDVPMDSSSIEPYYPRFKLYKMNGATKGAGCNPCNPVKVTSPAFSTSLGKFTWNNPTGCYDNHVIYLKKQTGTCSTVNCTGVDPSLTPDYTFTKSSDEDCSDAAPIANSLAVTGIATGTYCARIDVKKTHFTYDVATGVTTARQYTTKGDPFCFELDCATLTAPAITNAVPGDGSLITVTDNSTFSFSYANATRIVFRLNGHDVETLVTAYSATPQSYSITMTNVTAYAKPSSARNDWQILAENACTQTNVTGYFLADYKQGEPGGGGSQTPVTCDGCREQLSRDYNISISDLPSGNGTYRATWQGACSWSKQTSQWYVSVYRTLQGGIYEWRVTMHGFGVDAPNYLFGGTDHQGPRIPCDITGTYWRGNAKATVVPVP